MAGFRIVEDQSSYKDESLAWDRIVHSYSPELDVLPEDDQSYFKSIIHNLINKEPALSNIPPAHMYVYILRARRIFNLMSYPMVVSREYVRKEIGKYIHALRIRLSENGLGWLSGPLSQTTHHVKQELTQRNPVIQVEQ